MAMRDKVSAETRDSGNLKSEIDKFRKSKSLLHMTDAIRELLSLALKMVGRNIDIPPKHLADFNKDDNRLGFSVTKGTHAFVTTYAVEHDIDVREAYFELILKGLKGN